MGLLAFSKAERKEEHAWGIDTIKSMRCIAIPCKHLQKRRNAGKAFWTVQDIISSCALTSRCFFMHSARTQPQSLRLSNGTRAFIAG